MLVMNTDTKSHLAKTHDRCLKEAEMKQIKMFLEAQLHQRTNSLPLLDSIDGLLGVEAGGYLEKVNQMPCNKVAENLI